MQQPVEVSAPPGVAPPPGVVVPVPPHNWGFIQFWKPSHVLTPLVASLQDCKTPLLLTVGTFHVSGRLQVDVHADLPWVWQTLWAFVRPPIWPAPPEKMVMTTSAVIRMTIAETTTANVVFIQTTQVAIGVHCVTVYGPLPPLLSHTQFNTWLQDIIAPFTFMFPMPHVEGCWPVPMQMVL